MSERRSFGVAHSTDTNTAALQLDPQVLALIDALPLGVIFADMSGRLVHINPEAQRIMGGETPMSAGVAEYVDYVGWWTDSGELVLPHQWAMARALDGEVCVGQVIDLQRVDGGRATILNSGSPLRDPGGTLTGGMVVFQDITEQRERQRLSDLTSRIGELAASTLHAEEVLSKVLEEAVHALDASSAVLYTFRNDEWMVQEQYGTLPRPISTDFMNAEVQYSMESKRTRRVLAVPDTRSDARVDDHLAQAYGIKAFIDVPVLAKGILAGDFVVHFSDRRQFSDTEEKFLADVAFAIGRALSVSAEFQGTEEVATALQNALIDLPGRLPGVVIDSSYSSAAEVARVGGDFYDAMQIHDGRIMLVLGDVSGKGLEAAKLMMAVRNAMRAYQFFGDEPHEVLRKTNELLVATTEQHMFVTAFLGLLDPTDGALTYCSAGHPAGLMRRADGAIERLAETGPVLGAFPDLGFHSRTDHLSEGDYLFLYTDGVIEASDGDSRFGDTRLEEIIAKAATAREACKSVVSSVKAFSGGRLVDDMAILAVGLADDAEGHHPALPANRSDALR